MPDVIELLQSCLGGDPVPAKLLGDAMEEITELSKRRDALEEILIILVRTGLPWDESGKPTDTFPMFKERYSKAMHEASELLGLELRSTITRTEPRT
jgi:hypothetical protein